MSKKKNKTISKIKRLVALAVMLFALLIVYLAPPDEVRALFFKNLKWSRCCAEQTICSVKDTIRDLAEPFGRS
jgi:hypothetical protein